MRLLRKAWRWVVVRLYNEYTIARYFRAQGASIGEGARLLVRDLGSEPYLVTIGKQALVSSDVLFITHDGGTWVVRDREPNVSKFGRIVIGERAFVGARAILLPGITVGSRSVIGAGSVVTRDVPAGTVVAGVPARVVCSTDEYIARINERSVSVPHFSSREELRDFLVDNL